MGIDLDGTKNGTCKDSKGRRVMVVADPSRESACALEYALSHAMTDTDELILLNVIQSCKNSKGGSLGSIGIVFKKHLDIVAHAASDISSVDNGNVFGEGSDFLEEMKMACEKANPKVKVRVDKVEQGGMDKGTTILFRSKYLSVNLLIIGQRRTISNVLLGQRKNGALPRLGNPLPRLGKPIPIPMSMPMHMHMIGGTKPTLGPRPIDNTAEFLIENSYCTCVGVQKKGQNAGYLLNTKTRKNYWQLA